MNGISNVDTKILDQLGLKGSPEKVVSEGEKQRNEFLKLFMAQLKNQDPLEPQDGSEMIGQLAQFSTVEGIQNLQKSFDNLAGALQSSQTLQATSLIGKKIQIASNNNNLTEDGSIYGTIELPRSVADLYLTVEDTTGKLIDRVPLGTHAAGDLDFVWHGKDYEGNPVPPGKYVFKAQALIDGKPESFNTFMFANVDSVSIDRAANNVYLNVAGFGTLTMDQVKKIS